MLLQQMMQEFTDYAKYITANSQALDWIDEWDGLMD
jgi:hypothetical protein